MAEKSIGIVAGVGPFAGADLLGKVLEQTVARRDQDHLTVVSLSRPSQIVDRTEFLLGRVAESPVAAFVEQLLQLEGAGAQVAGIPCNTAHAPAIWEGVVAGLQAAGSGLELVHMVEATAVHLHHYYPHCQHIGVLSTTGTYLTAIYPQILARWGLTAVVPDLIMQEERIHPAIYHASYGLKACGYVTHEARDNLETAVSALQAKGAQAIILGCTEMPLVITEASLNGLPMIDPTLILARALIQAANPAKLKPLHL